MYDSDDPHETRIRISKLERSVRKLQLTTLVLGLAAKIGIKAEEADLDLFDATSAEEGFMSSTSLCMCPIRSINNRTLGSGSIPGPITQALIDAWSEEIDFDFVGQFLRHLQVPTSKTA